MEDQDASVIINTIKTTSEYCSESFLSESFILVRLRLC